MTYLGALVLIGFLIFIHELGHFAAARLTGVPVARFSIGFGPRLFSHSRNGVEYVLSAIPLGGYLLPAIASEEEYLKLPLGKRLIFAAGGPAFNILFAFAAFSLLAVMANGMSLQTLFIEPFLRTTGGIAGIFGAFATLFQNLDQLSSVVGIVNAGSSYISSGFAGSLAFAAVISLNLAVFNLLPLPPLDGGKMVMDIATAFRPPLLKVYGPMAVAGWVFLIGLMVYATILDVGRIA